MIGTRTTTTTYTLDEKRQIATQLVGLQAAVKLHDQPHNLKARQLFDATGRRQLFEIADLNALQDAITILTQGMISPPGTAEPSRWDD